MIGSAVRIAVVGSLALGLATAAAFSASAATLTTRVSPGEAQGFNPQPDPPGLPQCEGLSFYNAHVSACEPKLMAAYPPGPCKTESYMNRHFTSCVASIRVP